MVRHDNDKEVMKLITVIQVAESVVCFCMVPYYLLYTEI